MATDAIEWQVVDAQRAFRWGRVGQDVVAEWNGVLALRARADGEVISWSPAPGARKDIVDKLRCGVAAAFLRALRGKHSLHASAVAYGGSALVCVGESGAGKSTVAASLCNKGARLLADDIAGIEAIGSRWHIVPSEPVLWLRHRESEDKATVSADLAEHPAAIEWIAMFRFDDTANAPVVHRLRGGDAVAALVGAMVRFEATPAVWASELDLVGALTAQAGVFEVARSRHVTAEDVAMAMIAEVRPRNEGSCR
jgi:hypothetical protein